MPHKTRIQALHEEIEAMDIDGAVVFSPENLYYLTGAPFVAGGVGKLLYLDKDGRSMLMVEGIDYEEAHDCTDEVELVRMETGERPIERLKKIGGSSLGFEEEFISYKLYENLSKRFKLVPVKGATKLREVKEQDEIDRITESQRSTERALEKATEVFKEGMTELEIASEIEYNMRREGAILYAYDSLVASGPRAVYPHGMPTAREARNGDAVIIDVGSKTSGYCSDMTRTFFFGTPSGEMKNIYEQVLESQEAAIEAATPGMRGKELDAVARGFLERKGLAKYFVHGLGHGVGIAVHEGPMVNSRGEDYLVPGNVVTAEPGVYISKLGGVRIEDMILITEKNSQNLTRFTKELLVF